MTIPARGGLKVEPIFRCCYCHLVSMTIPARGGLKAEQNLEQIQEPKVSMTIPARGGLKEGAEGSIDAKIDTQFQ